MLTSRSLEQGVDQHTLDLTQLLEGNTATFNTKWQEFLKSDALIPEVFEKQGDTLSYLCDHHVPECTDSRQPLFLLFGNSTPHSIVERLYFAYEGNEREHRMWKLLKEFGIYDFDLDDNLTLRERNEYRNKALFDLSYSSHFRVAMDVFFSIPTTPSRPPWSGVAGVQKLLGIVALRQLAEFEQKRLSGRIEKFLGAEGAIITFQKNAYNGIVSKDSAPFTLKAAVEGTLQGRYVFNESIPVYGVAPTRWLNGGEARASLKRVIDQLRS